MSTNDPRVTRVADHLRGREDGFFRRIFPPIIIDNFELDRYEPEEFPGPYVVTGPPPYFPNPLPGVHIPRYQPTRVPERVVWGEPVFIPTQGSQAIGFAIGHTAGLLRAEF